MSRSVLIGRSFKSVPNDWSVPFVRRLLCCFILVRLDIHPAIEEISMASDVRVRFAPSPTGKLHIGAPAPLSITGLLPAQTAARSSCASTTPTPPVPPTRTRRLFCAPCVGWVLTGTRSRGGRRLWSLCPDRAPGPVQAGRPAALGRGQGLSLLLHQGAARGRSQGRSGAQGPLPGLSAPLPRS